MLLIAWMYAIVSPNNIIWDQFTDYQIWEGLIEGMIMFIINFWFSNLLFPYAFLKRRDSPSSSGQGSFLKGKFNVWKFIDIIESGGALESGSNSLKYKIAECYVKDFPFGTLILFLIFILNE